MPAIVAMTIFCAVTLGCAPWAAAKEDGVPGRRVGGGTRLEISDKFPQTVVLGNDRRSSAPKPTPPHRPKIQPSPIAAATHF